MNPELIAAFFDSLPHEDNDPDKPLRATVCFASGQQTQQVSLLAWDDTFLLVGYANGHQRLYTWNEISFISR